MERWNLRLRVFLFFALIATGAIVALGAGFTLALSRLGDDALPTLVLAFGAAGFAITGMALWVWLQFDENMAKPILAIGHDVRAAVHGGARRAASPSAGRYLGFLSPAVAEVTGELAAARAKTEERIAEATAAAEDQRARLETVLRDLQEGVLICNLDHEILLYNQRAVEVLHETGEVGLGRPLFGLVAGEPFRFVLDRLQRRFQEDRYDDHPDGLTAVTTTTTRIGGQTLKAHVALMLDGEAAEALGYVVAFDDATEEIEAAARRDGALHAVADQLRRRIANLSSLTEVALVHAPAADRSELEATLALERDALGRELDALDESRRDALANPWPTSPIYASTLIAILGDRVVDVCAVNTSGLPPEIWVRCDGATMIGVLAQVLERLARSGATQQVLVDMRASAGRVMVDFVWSGTRLEDGRLAGWLEESLGAGFGHLSGKDVLDRHRTDLWCVERGHDEHALRLPLPRAEPAGRKPRKVAPTLSARPEFYDFDLFGRRERTAFAEAPLKELTYVVFDTETTGLEPQRDDEIVQIGGVRIVNGRILKSEAYDRLVNPGRRIPPASTRIHGIGDADVALAEPLLPAIGRFHAYAGGAVLVAHNAAFDMSFLTKHKREIDVAFTQPVLDTVLLAAHVFGPGAKLTLDALAERFGVRLPERDRHTALGDALATAEVFLKLVALLEAEGTATLGDALRVSERQVALRRRQGAYQA